MVIAGLKEADMRLQSAVLRELRWDTVVNGASIGVSVSDGAVTLTGTVDSVARRGAAESAALRVAGVRDVTNEVVVRPSGSWRAAASSPREEDLRRAIADALLRHAAREAKRIDVALADGTVTVSGTVLSWAERQAVVDAVGATPGVRSVHDLLQVEH